MSEEKKGSGFVVKDKRLFAEGDTPAEKEEAVPPSEEKTKLKEEGVKFVLDKVKMKECQMKD